MSEKPKALYKHVVGTLSAQLKKLTPEERVELLTQLKADATSLISNPNALAVGTIPAEANQPEVTMKSSAGETVHIPQKPLTVAEKTATGGVPAPDTTPASDTGKMTHPADSNAEGKFDAERHEKRAEFEERTPPHTFIDRDGETMPSDTDADAPPPKETKAETKERKEDERADAADAKADAKERRADAASDKKGYHKP